MKLLNSLLTKRRDNNGLQKRKEKEIGGITMEEIIKGFVPEEGVPVATEETEHFDGEMEEI